MSTGAHFGFVKYTIDMQKASRGTCIKCKRHAHNTILLVIFGISGGGGGGVKSVTEPLMGVQRTIIVRGGSRNFQNRGSRK